MLYPQYFIDDLKNRANLVRMILRHSKGNWAVPLIYLLVMFTFSLSCYSQEKPAARLVDSVGKTSCEDYMARTDMFGIELEKAPSSKGVIVWYGSGGENGRLADIYADFMHRMLLNKFGNGLKVSVLRSTERSELSADSWLVSKDIDFTLPNSRIVAEIPFKVTKKTLYAISTVGPCSNYDNYGFATILLSDPNLTGLIVDVSSTHTSRSADAADILTLFRELKIPRDRLRIFFKRPSTHLKPELGYWELWLVPRQQK